MPGVVGVGDVLTFHSSPDQITVMMNVDFNDEIRAGEVERVVCRIEEEAQDRWPTGSALVRSTDAGRGRQAETLIGVFRRSGDALTHLLLQRA